jgi:hypothetical protein
VPSQNPIVDVQWSGATDTGIGVDGYSFEWSQSASTLPDTTKDADAASTGTTSPTLANGSWYLHVRTVDKLGHWTATAATIGPFVIAQSTPPKKCVVPKVVGKTLKAAKAAIKKAHCSMGKVSYASAPKAKRGRVLKQSPKPGKRLAAGARVNLTVGRAKKH